MFKIYLIAIISSVLSASAQADMICNAQTSRGDEVKVTVSLSNNNPVEVNSVKIETPFSKSNKIYSNLTKSDDGMRILLSAPGLMLDVSYEFGCFRNANVISDVNGYGLRFLEPLTINNCTGGTTADELCMGN